MRPELHFAEYVSPGHPDRLADAVAEACVTHALEIDPDALVGVEVAVSTDKVFVTGRIAAGPDGPGAAEEFLPPLAARAYRAAGYGGRWAPDPERLIVTHDLCCDPLTPDEREVRRASDDQAVCVGYACGDESMEFLPPAHWLAHRLGAALHEWRLAHAADVLGPDFKLLPVLEELPTLGARPRYAWRRLVLSVQHVPGLSYEAQHRLLDPVLAGLLAELDGVLPGVGDFTPAHLHLNGAGAFSVGGPFGDNGLSGKKLVVDGFGPSVPIGGGAFFGKDPHKIDRRGARLAREHAIALVRQGASEARVTLVWLPGEAEPSIVDVRTSADGAGLHSARSGAEGPGGLGRP